jgi:hypothetical protein
MQRTGPRLLLITSEWPHRGRRLTAQPGPRSLVKQQAEALQAAGASVEIFAFRGRGMLNYAAAWARLRPQLLADRYDLVHAQEAANGLLALPKRVPLVVTVRRRSSRRFLHHLLALVLARRADAVIVASAELGRQLRTRKPIFVIGPDTDHQALTERLLAVYRSVLPGWSNR